MPGWYEEKQILDEMKEDQKRFAEWCAQVEKEIRLEERSEQNQQRRRNKQKRRAPKNT